jgi:DNA repair protein RadC
LKIDGLKGIGGRPLWEGHRNRLRQRLEREGWDALKSYEMVEVVLCHALPRQDLSAVSRLLVDRFGSVGGVFRATREALLSVPGVTPGMAEWINLTGALVSAYRQMHNISDIRLECYRQVKYFLRPLLPEKQRTGLWVIYSDFDFNLITISDLRENEIWWEADNVRRVLMDAIGHDARYIYMVLWKDRPAEGMDDAELARLDSIASALCAAELDLVDCLLVNGDELFSMRIHGRMNRIRATAAGDSLRERYAAE